MIKYLHSLTDRLDLFINGITKFSTRWSTHGVAPADVQTKADQTATMEKAVETQKQLLSDKQTEARKLQDDIELFLTQLENLAFAIHVNDPENLPDYGLEERPSPTPRLQTV